MNKKNLIIQFRHGFLETNEQQLFMDRLGLAREAFIFFNCLDSQQFPELSQVERIVMCGSGDHSMTHDHHWFTPLKNYILSAIDHDIPILGICFGHQILGKIMGAEVVNDVRQKEIGTVPISLTQKGMTDPLFTNIKKEFYSMEGHNDSVIHVPDSFDLLATNTTCEVQAIKLKGADVYGVQFHPEMNENDFRERIEHYREHYIDAHVNIESLIAKGTTPTDHDAILKNFFTIGKK